MTLLLIPIDEISSPNKIKFFIFFFKSLKPNFILSIIITSPHRSLCLFNVNENFTQVKTIEVMVIKIETPKSSVKDK